LLDFWGLQARCYRVSSVENALASGQQRRGTECDFE
jgi:hypothetical protein